MSEDVFLFFLSLKNGYLRFSCLRMCEFMCYFAYNKTHCYEDERMDYYSFFLF